MKNIKLLGLSLFALMALACTKKEEAPAAAPEAPAAEAAAEAPAADAPAAAETPAATETPAAH